MKQKQTDLVFFFQMLENQPLVVMLCKLQCICCVKTFVFGILFPIFLAVGVPPLDLGVSYKFHETVLCQHCVKNKIRNVTLLCHIYLITTLNKIQCLVTASVNKDDFMVICFLHVKLASVSCLCVTVCQHLPLFLLLDMFSNLSNMVSINPLSPSIHIQILQTVLHTFA